MQKPFINFKYSTEGTFIQLKEENKILPSVKLVFESGFWQREYISKKKIA